MFNILVGYSYESRLKSLLKMPWKALLLEAKRVLVKKINFNNNAGALKVFRHTLNEYLKMFLQNLMFI